MAFVQRLTVFARFQDEVIACAVVQRRAGGEGGAAVEEVAVEFDVDVILGNQRAGVVDVAGFDLRVDLRHQHGQQGGKRCS